MSEVYNVKPLDFQWNESSKSWQAIHPAGDFEIVPTNSTHQLWCYFTNGHAFKAVGFDSLPEALAGANVINKNRLLPALELVDPVPAESVLSEYVAQMEVKEYDYSDRSHEEEPVFRDYSDPQDAAYKAQSTYAEWGQDLEYYAKRFARNLGSDLPLYRFRTVRRETVVHDIVIPATIQEPESKP